MHGSWLIWTGSALIGLWGLAHLVVTARIVNGFPPLDGWHRRTLLMEWVAEGLTLMFLGGLAALVSVSAGAAAPLGNTVVRACSIFLLVLAAWSRMTGARGGPLPMRLCPLVKTAAAALLWVGTTA